MAQPDTALRRRPGHPLAGRARAPGRSRLRGRPPGADRVSPVDALRHRSRRRAGAPRGDRSAHGAARDHLGSPRLGGRGLERGARGGDGPGPRRRGHRSAPPGGAVPGGREPCGRCPLRNHGSGRGGAGDGRGVLPILCRPASVGDPVVVPAECSRSWAGRQEPLTVSVACRTSEPGRRPSWASAWWRTPPGGTWSWVSELPGAAVAELPEELDGRAFLQRWGASGDDVTTVRPEETYPVRAATLFGVAGARARRGGLGGIA